MNNSTAPRCTPKSRTTGWLAAALLPVGATIALGSAASAAAAPDASCPGVEVVFARGTWEPAGVGATGQAFINALDARLAQPVAVYGVDYPASLDFQAAAGGVADASNEIESIAASCPNTKVVLGGYSQGAAVAAYTTADSIPAGLTLPPGITGVVPPKVASHVAAVALFGTPDPWFLNLVDHAAPPITVGNLYAGKTIQLCATGDPVCYAGGLDRSAHSSYKDNGMADQAAAFVTSELNSTAEAQS